MEFDYKPPAAPKPLENNPTVLGMLQSRGDAAIQALETMHMQMKQLTHAIGQTLMDLRKFDTKVGIPTSPEHRKAAMLDNVRRARPDLAQLSDADLLTAIRSQKAPQ